MKLLIEICVILCRILKINAHACIYSLSNLNIVHCVELTFPEASRFDF